MNEIDREHVSKQAVDTADVLHALAAVVNPDTGTDIVTDGLIKGLQIKDGHVAFAIEVAPERGTAMETMRAAAEKAVFDLPGAITATVVLTAETKAASPARGARAGGAPLAGGAPRAGGAPTQPGRPVSPGKDTALLPGVGHVVAVASGKGGVGKSTTAVNLALGFMAAGLRVGLLDADIYGPSMPRMMGITGKPVSVDGRTLDPMENYGVKVMSIGFLVDEETPMIWRGPMVQSALEQLMRDVNWGDLDVLVVDMPPGTGDVQLTMAQRVPLSGVVIVSTPQDIALLDARKGLNMFTRVEVPVLGIVENMSYFLCPDNNKRYDIFGHGGARREADRLGVPFLGEVPIEIDIREGGDAGTPMVIAHADSRSAATYRDMAKRLWAHLGTNGPAAGPRIVVPMKGPPRRSFH